AADPSRNASIILKKLPASAHMGLRRHASGLAEEFNGSHP
ncbi:hypothetical protein CEXT_577911, partial [Caerostris extrusa]